MANAFCDVQGFIWNVKMNPIDVRRSTIFLQATVVESVDSAICWVNHYITIYSAYNSIGFDSGYPVDSNLSALSTFWTTEPRMIVASGRTSYRLCNHHWNYQVIQATYMVCLFLVTWYELFSGLYR